MCVILLEKTAARENGREPERLGEPSNLNASLHPSGGEKGGRQAGGVLDPGQLGKFREGVREPGAQLSPQRNNGPALVSLLFSLTGQISQWRCGLSINMAIEFGQSQLKPPVNYASST